MNYTSASQARRYRTSHTAFSLCLPIAFLGMLFLALAKSPPPTWLLFASAAWFFGFLIAGLLGVWIVQRAMLRAIDPDSETWRRVRELTWFRPFGSFWAVNELLRSAAQK
jgi:hypothetical protein